MPWIVACVISAFFLGCYDLCTKHAVRDNAVLPVLFVANLCSASVRLTLMALPLLSSATMPTMLSVAPLSVPQHLLLAAKSLLVACSWLCGYFAVKHLHVSLASPNRATGPVWTLFGALLVLGERPPCLEMFGVAITLASFIGLSALGAR